MDSKTNTEACKGCGSFSIDVDANEPVCVDCGSVQKSVISNNYFHLNDGKESDNNFVYFGDSKKNYFKISWRRKFFMVFESMTVVLNTNSNLYQQALHHLPSVYLMSKKYDFNKRQKFIAALLYLVYRSNDWVVSMRYFATLLDVDKLNLASAIKKVDAALNLYPYHSRDKGKELHTYINEVSPMSLKDPSHDQVKEITSNAIRLADVILEHKWYGAVFPADFKVALTCVWAAAFYNVSGKKTLMNFKAIYSKYNVGVTPFERFLRHIRTKLLEVALQIPWKPSFIKSSNNVALFLPDILRYLENELNEEEELDIVDRANFPDSVLNLLFDAVRHDMKSNPSPELFGKKGNVDVKLLQQIISSHVCSLKSDKDSTEISALEIVALDREISILSVPDAKMSFGELRLVYDLIKAGCTNEELKTRQYIQLTKKYLDNFSEQEKGQVDELSNEDDLDNQF